MTGKQREGIQRPILWAAVIAGVVVFGVAGLAAYSLEDVDRTIPNYVLIVQTAGIVLGLGSVLLLGLQLSAANKQAACSVEQLTLANQQASCSVEQLALTAKQLAQTAIWNKTLSYHQFFGDLVTRELADKVRVVATKHKFDEAFTSLTAMSPTALTDLMADREAEGVISAYLDEFEEFCAAVKAGVVENSYAYGIEATRVIRAAVVFGPFILRARSGTKYSRAYLELEDLGAQWQKRRHQEEEEARNANGIKPHV